MVRKKELLAAIRLIPDYRMIGLKVEQYDQLVWAIACALHRAYNRGLAKASF